jgi:hypothetical protein
VLNVNNSLCSCPNVQSPAFKRQDNYYYSSPSTKTRRLAIGASSLLAPGLGQVINGENSKGIAFFLGILCCSLLGHKRHKLPANLIDIAGWGVAGWAAYDAYKHS